jgi:hypothetical protein
MLPKCPASSVERFSFAERNYVWGRFENVDRTNELLLLNRFEPPTFEENIIGRLQGYTAGYEHRRIRTRSRSDSASRDRQDDSSFSFQHKHYFSLDGTAIARNSYTRKRKCSKRNTAYVSGN